MGNTALRRHPKTPPIEAAADKASPSSDASSDREHQQHQRREDATTTPMSANAAPWRALVEKSLARNRALPNARYIQIATVRPDGRPSNRTVVFR